MVAATRDVAATLDVATRTALQGDLLQAREMFLELLSHLSDPDQIPRATSNFAAIEAALGHTEHAVQHWESIPLEQRTASARANLAYLKGPSDEHSLPSSGDSHPQRIAILSLLFSWPSTGGGTVHTKELAEFLAGAGYSVRHLYARYEPWDVGCVQDPLPYDSRQLRFQAADWNETAIIDRFRNELRQYQPDWVIVTDSWNSKPLLVEAAEGFRTLIRIAAQECLCPLNNVRMLMNTEGLPQQCSLTQLADPQACQSCVVQNGRRLSGALHQAERELCGFGTEEYAQRIRQAFARAEGVLAVNPAIAESFRPHTQSAYVVPSGFDVRRFPDVAPPPDLAERKLRILFAGLTHEFMKGFHVLRDAARLLWSQRQDFEVCVTGEPDDSHEPWLRPVGWQSQEQLPELISACDLLVFPTIAQEGLGRTAVEAMACGRPVVASRIGGLNWVVEDGVTGLLCTPGSAEDLAAKCAQLLDDPALRQQFGAAGRSKFEREFTWQAILEQHYLPLLGPPVRAAVS